MKEKRNSGLTKKGRALVQKIGGITRLEAEDRNATIEPVSGGYDVTYSNGEHSYFENHERALHAAWVNVMTGTL